MAKKNKEKLEEDLTEAKPNLVTDETVSINIEEVNEVITHTPEKLPDVPIAKPVKSINVESSSHQTKKKQFHKP